MKKLNKIFTSGSYCTRTGVSLKQVISPLSLRDGNVIGGFGGKSDISG
jgi:hypothetical protein